jgi:hypothetical protein
MSPLFFSNRHFLLLQGFAERKLLLVCDVIRACKDIHAAEAKAERLAAQQVFFKVRFQIRRSKVQRFTRHMQP